MNNWYNRINSVQPTQPTITFQNPMQQMSYVMNAMRDPAAFILEQFPDVPENIRNNPNEVLAYLQQTRGNKFVQDVMRISGMSGRR